MSNSTTCKSLNMNSVNHGKLSQRFDLIRKLGQGTYGKVQLGINKMTGVEVALKTIKKSKIENSSDLLRIKREISIMSCCNHPNIIHIYEVYENREKIILVMEYAPGGELYDYLNEKKKFEEIEAKRIFSQISSAIYYCHKHKIVHRDLKLENILLDENNNAKIADFGLSNVYGDQLLKTFCGSPLYASPEIVKGIPYHGPEVDCWSLGVLLYTLIYGSMPFDGTHFKKLVKQITSGSFYEPSFKSGAFELIKSLLCVDSKKRLDIRQVVAHPWLSETDCLSNSEEFCHRAPAKSEFLIGINKSDTLDEVSDISSASTEENGEADQKINTKPPSKNVKISKEQEILSKTQSKLLKHEDNNLNEKKDEVKPLKPLRNDKSNLTEISKNVSEAQKSKPETLKLIEVGKNDKDGQQNLKPESHSSLVGQIEPNEKSKEPMKLKKDISKATEVFKTEKDEKKIEKIQKEPSKIIENIKNDRPGEKIRQKEVIIGNKTDTKLMKPLDEVGKIKINPLKSNHEPSKSKFEPIKPIGEPMKGKSPIKEEIKIDEKLKSSVGVSSIGSTHVPESKSQQHACATHLKGDLSTPTTILPDEVLSVTTTPILNPTNVERRNSKILSQKTAELIQNLKEGPKIDSKKSVPSPSKLNDIKKKFENGIPSKDNESGIGVMLKRRKSISERGQSPENSNLPPSTDIDFKIISKSSEPSSTMIGVQKYGQPIKGPHQQSPPTFQQPMKINNTNEDYHRQGVVERENEPSSKPPLKLIMPKSTKLISQQSLVSASPPITKQGAVKKIGSLITKVKSNDSANMNSTSSRERIIPIQYEDDHGSPVSRSTTGGSSGSPSRTGSKSYVSVESPASTSTSPSYSRHNSIGNGIQTQTIGGSGCQIMKSKREFIIPITIEERDDSDSMDSRSRRNSSAANTNSSVGSTSNRVYSNRRHTSSNLSLLTPDSTDLDDDFFDDDDFLAPDALFSSLLQRVRGLRLGDRIQNNEKKRRGEGRWTLDFN